jgi:uncharacterized protein YjgD (DUF1641 family)
MVSHVRKINNMKISDIFNLLEGNLDSTQFTKKYKNEFRNFEVQRQKKGASISIIVDEDLSFDFNETHLAKICKLFLTDKLTEPQVNYITDCLTMSESVRFKESLLEILETFTDPEVNRKLNKAEVKNILDSIL